MDSFPALSTRRTCEKLKKLPALGTINRPPEPEAAMLLES